MSSTKSVEEITSFILAQFDKRLTSLEEESNNQKTALKSIKKNQKLAQMITKPLSKPATSAEPAQPSSIADNFKDYVRTKYPEPSGYINNYESLKSTPKSKEKDFSLAYSPFIGYADASQIASKSILELILEPKEVPKRSKTRTKSATTLMGFRKANTEEFGSEWFKTANTLGEDGIELAMAKDQTTPNGGRISKFDLYSKGVVQTRNVLKHYKGGVNFKVY